MYIFETLGAVSFVTVAWLGCYALRNSRSLGAALGLLLSGLALFALGVGGVSEAGDFWGLLVVCALFIAGLPALITGLVLVCDWQQERDWKPRYEPSGLDPVDWDPPFGHDLARDEKPVDPAEAARRIKVRNQLTVVEAMFGTSVLPDFRPPTKAARSP